MLTTSDFAKKQLAVVFCNEGEKMALNNSNFVVKNSDGKIKFQCSCYRIFLIYVIGHCSITTPLMQASKKFGFYFALMSPGFRLYNVIGAEKNGNTMLHRKQYNYSSLDIAIHITQNKILNQLSELKNIRNKSDYTKDGICKIESYYNSLLQAKTLNEIMAYEGLSSKIYFKCHFNNVPWKGRQPRLKRDYINSALDVGYTILFSFIDAILSSYGFDTFAGVMHTEFYMRKSLVCDIVEPFRTIIDHELKKAINLKQIKEDDFIFMNNQYKLKFEESPKYSRIFISALLERRNEIFLYIQSYYRAFMKELPISEYPIYQKGE